MKAIVYSSRHSHLVVDLFAYTSKGLPGLQIIGQGNRFQCLREKILYLGRHYQLKIPLRRYVIGIETADGPTDISADEWRWLEFPILVTFWYLAGRLNLYQMENCYSSGKLSPSGDVTHLNLPPRFFRERAAHELAQMRLITSERAYCPVRRISSEEIFRECAPLRFDHFPKFELLPGKL